MEKEKEESCEEACEHCDAMADGVADKYWRDDSILTGPYYSPPSQVIFDEVKSAAMSLWPKIDSDNDKYGYASGKIARIKNLANEADNFMAIVSMFDIHNQQLLSSVLSHESKEAIRERLRAGGADDCSIVF